MRGWIVSALMMTWGLVTPAMAQKAPRPRPLTLVEATKLSDAQLMERAFRQLTEQVDAVNRPPDGLGLPAPQGFLYPPGPGPTPSFKVLELRLKPTATAPVGLCRVDLVKIQFKVEPDQARWAGLARRPWPTPHPKNPDALPSEPAMVASGVTVDERYFYAPEGSPDATPQDPATREAACQKFAPDTPLLPFRGPDQLLQVKAARERLSQLLREKPLPFQLDCETSLCMEALTSSLEEPLLVVNRCSFDPKVGPISAAETCMTYLITAPEYSLITVIGSLSNSGDRWDWKIRRVIVDRLPTPVH